MKRNVIPVFPSPWRMLQSAPDIYRKGQTKESARICEAATGLAKRYVPSKSAEIQKNTMHPTPSAKQKTEVMQIRRLIRRLFPTICASETEGKSREDTAPVSALGNMISGMPFPKRHRIQTGNRIKTDRCSLTASEFVVFQWC